MAVDPHKMIEKLNAFYMKVVATTKDQKLKEKAQGKIDGKSAEGIFGPKSQFWLQSGPGADPEFLYKSLKNVYKGYETDALFAKEFAVVLAEYRRTPKSQEEGAQRLAAFYRIMGSTKNATDVWYKFKNKDDLYHKLVATYSKDVDSAVVQNHLTWLDKYINEEYTEDEESGEAESDSADQAERERQAALDAKYAAADAWCSEEPFRVEIRDKLQAFFRGIARDAGFDQKDREDAANRVKQVPQWLKAADIEGTEQKMADILMNKYPDQKAELQFLQQYADDMRKRREPPPARQATPPAAPLQPRGSV